MIGETEEIAVTGSPSPLSPEKQQEQELMGKLAATGKLPARPASSFLQKKLQQRKFFDSGDYAMDKSKATGALGSKPHPLAGVAPINEQNNRPAQKSPILPTVTPISPSQIQQQQAASVASTPSRPSAERGVEDDNLQIPRPDTVPQRKASIINPSVHCKLSPAPHVQHHHETSSSTSPSTNSNE